MSTRRFMIHGLCIESDLPLAALPAAPERKTEVRIALRAEWDRAVPRDALLVANRPGSRGYTAWKLGDDYLLRLPSACDFAVSAAGDRIDVHPASGAASDLLPLWTAGLALAFAVTLRGGLVLHASAFRLGGSTVAVAGRSGAGKTTVAALAVAAGCLLLADDAVCVETAQGAWLAHSASTELRLRNGTDRFGALFTSGSSSTDHRWLVRPPHAGAGPFPMSRIVFPTVTENGARLELAELDSHSAAIELLRGQRFGAWTDPAVLHRCTRAVAQLARDVRAMRLSVPGVQRLDRAFARRLLALLSEASETPAVAGARL